MSFRPFLFHCSSRSIPRLYLLYPTLPHPTVSLHGACCTALRCVHTQYLTQPAVPPTIKLTSPTLPQVTLPYCGPEPEEPDRHLIIQLSFSCRFPTTEIPVPFPLVFWPDASRRHTKERPGECVFVWKRLLPNPFTPPTLLALTEGPTDTYQLSYLHLPSSPLLYSTFLQPRHTFDISTDSSQTDDLSSPSITE